MKILCILMFIDSSVSAFDRMDDSYVVSYGNPSAAFKITEYYSLSCPGCVSLYRTDFQKIKHELISTGQVYYEFHIVPLDAFSLRVAICLHQLDMEDNGSIKKRALFETLMENISVGMPNSAMENTQLLKLAMEALKAPQPNIDSDEHVQKTATFEHALSFVTQQDIVTEMPVMQFDGIFQSLKIPTYENIISTMKYLTQPRDL